MKAQLFIVTSVLICIFLVTTYLMLKPDYLSSYRNYWKIKEKAIRESFKQLGYAPSSYNVFVLAPKNTIVNITFPSGMLPTNRILILNPKDGFYEYVVRDNILPLGTADPFKIAIHREEMVYAEYKANISGNVSVVYDNVELSLNKTITNMIDNFSAPVGKGDADFIFLDDAIIVETEAVTIKTNASSYEAGPNWIKIDGIFLVFDHASSINGSSGNYTIELKSGKLLRIFFGKISFDYAYSNVTYFIIKGKSGRSVEDYYSQEDWKYNYTHRTPVFLEGNSLLPLVLKSNVSAINISTTFSLLDGKLLIIRPFINHDFFYIYFNDTGLPASSPTDMEIVNQTGNVFFRNGFYEWNITSKELKIGGRNVLRDDVIVCIDGTCQNLSQLYFDEQTPAYAKIGPLLLLAEYPGILLDERNCKNISVRMPINFSSSDFIGINSKGKEYWIKSCDNASVGEWFNLTIACDERPSFIILGPKSFVEEACRSSYTAYSNMQGVEIQTLAGRTILFG